MTKNQLLVMPRFVDKIGEWYNFPLGIPYVSSSLKKEGFNLYTLNLNNIDGSIEDILSKEIEEKDIDIISTGGLTAQYNAIKTVISIAKNVRPDIITMVGGGIITSSPEPAMRALEYADYGIIGEGEITNCELSYALENNKELENIDGIIFKKGDAFYTTNPRKEIEDLDTIPFPDYEGFGFERIMDSVPSLVGMNETNTITMLSSRSCPYSCTFCFHTSGQKYRQRSLDNFFEELDYLVEKYGVRYIFIADELFSYDMERVKEFCNRIKDYNIKWWAQFRVPDINHSLVKLLKDSNCAIMGFGLESADNRILKSMKKNITVEQIEKSLKIVYDAGVTLQGNFIFGDVEETIETATNTLNWWKKHPEYGITLNFITVYPGTPLYKHAIKEGIIRDEIDFIRRGCPTINVSKMSQKERNWLSEQIVTLPQIELKEPQNIENVYINYKNKNMNLEGRCVSCNTKNDWENIRFLTRNVLICKVCGRQHKVPILDCLVKMIDSNIYSLLNNYNKIAFWGINDYVYEFLKNLESLSSDRIYLIDISQMKQGGHLNGKIICSPDIINEQDIDVVVISVLSFFSSIEKQVERECKNVKKTMSILDLIKE